MAGGHWVIKITNRHLNLAGLEKGPEFLSIYQEVLHRDLTKRILIKWTQ